MSKNEAAAFLYAIQLAIKYKTELHHVHTVLMEGKTARRHAIIRADQKPWRARVVVGPWKG